MMKRPHSKEYRRHLAPFTHQYDTVYLAYSNKLKYYAKTKKILLVLYERFNSER